MKRAILLTFMVTTFFVYSMEESNDKEIISFPNYIGEVSEQFIEFAEIIQHRETLTKIGIETPKTILVSGDRDAGKTTLIKDLANAVSAYLYPEKALSLDNNPEIQAENCIQLYENMLSSNDQKILFFHANFLTGTLYYDTVKAIKKKIEENKEIDIFLIVELQQSEPSQKNYQHFDKVISIPLPDAKNRQAIFEHFSQKITIPVEPSIYLSLADKLEGFTAIQIKNLINQAAIKAALEKSPQVTEKNVLDSLEETMPTQFRETKVKEEQKELFYFL